MVVLTAPAGYRKGTFLRAYAAHAGRLTACDLRADAAAPDPARQVLDALVAEDRARAGRSAADRLAQRAEAAVANAREALRREWAVCDEPQLVALRDVADALATPAGADLFAGLVAALPNARVLAVSRRSALPPALQHIVAAEHAATVTADDLALTPDETIDLARAAELSIETGRTIYELAGGWPLVSELLVGLVRHGDRVEELAEAVRTLNEPALLAFAAHRTIARLDDLVRDAVIVAALLHRVTHVQLVRVLGNACDDLVFARLSQLPFIVRSGDDAIVHPDVARILRERFPSTVKSLYERTLNALTGEGAYVGAAHLALDQGDVMRAAAIIDAAPPYTATPVPLVEYERIIEHLDRGQLTRFPKVWIATIPHRSFAVDRVTFVREAETVYFCLPSISSADERAAALMLLASAYCNCGRAQEAERLLDEALAGFARDAIPARVSLLHFRASVHGMDGHFTMARALAAEAARMSRDGFGETQTLHYIDAHEAAYRGQNERLSVIVDELLRRNDDLPLHRANTAANGLMWMWVGGDDERFVRYLGILEDALTPGLERGFRPIVDAARGRSVAQADGYLWSIGNAQAQLYRLGNAASDDEALDAARAAARCADERLDPYAQILAHTALYVLDVENRAHEADRLKAIVAPVESEEMHAAIGLLLRGEPPGMLAPFVRRRVRRERAFPGVPQLVVELLAGRVVRDGMPVRLSDKEFELLALLGVADAPLSRERIGEALWDHLDPEEWGNNLKVTLSRLRTKLAMPDVVVRLNGRYRLSPVIAVDLRRAESLLRECLGDPLDDGRRAQLSAILAAFRFGEVARYDRLTWSEQLKARIEDLACRAGTLLADDALAHGRLDEALRFAGDVAAIDPLDEAASETTVRVSLARGDAGAARREFRRYATSLANELGAAPSPRFAALVRDRT